MTSFRYILPLQSTHTLTYTDTFRITLNFMHQANNKISSNTYTIPPIPIISLQNISPHTTIKSYVFPFLFRVKSTLKVFYEKTNMIHLWFFLETHTYRWKLFSSIKKDSSLSSNLINSYHQEKALSIWERRATLATRIWLREKINIDPRLRLKRSKNITNTRWR